MAIWDGGSLNTNELASNTNKWDSLNFSPIVVKRQMLLYAMMALRGLGGNAEIPNWNAVFSDPLVDGGNNLVVRLLGELETISTLADANETDAVAWNANTNRFGAAVFAWTHYSHNEAVPDHEYDLIRGNEAKTESYMQDTLQALAESRRDTIATAINSTNNQARTTLGGWEYAVDSTGTYGTLTRAGDNPNWSGNETDVGGDGGLDDLDDMKLDVQQDGGNASVGVCGKVPFNKIKRETRGYTAALPTSWRFWEGGGLLHYDGTTYGFEHRCTSTVCGLLTPSTFAFYRQAPLDGDAAFEVLDQKIMKAVLKGAKLGFALRDWTAFVCRHPGANGKLTGWTS